jgi:hypothetical protein
MIRPYDRQDGGLRLRLQPALRAKRRARSIGKTEPIEGTIFYNWQGNIHAPKEDRASAFRCGTLTGSGRLAIDPM